ncbi:MAG: hypothetical protein ACFFF9_06360 [Candidatus Thorarchaeota archaeon]
MSSDIITRLQALYHSGDITGYIHSNLPVDLLKTGWIEKGLLSKGMRGQLRDKHNQESLIIPADRFTRLTRDMTNTGYASIAIIGSKGLREGKFAAMVYENKNVQSLIAFRIQHKTPLEIIQLFLQVLGGEISNLRDEPNLDYVEQIRIDTGERIVEDALVISLPKEIMKISEWIKATIQEKSSESILLRHGSSKELVVFSALLTRWVTSLELFRETRSAIAACVFVKKKQMDVCFWDSSQKIASFASIGSANIEELGRKYLIPLWMVPGDSLKPLPKKKEVVVEPRLSKTTKLQREEETTVDTGIKVLSRRLDQLSGLESKLESLETRLQTSSNTQSLDKGSLEALQSRLSENIDRIEILSKRLIELERRIKKISG